MPRTLDNLQTPAQQYSVALVVQLAFSRGIHNKMELYLEIHLIRNHIIHPSPDEFLN